MRRKLLYLVVNFIIIVNFGSNAQYSIIDSYNLSLVNYTSPTYPQVGAIPQYINQNFQIVYDSELPTIAGSYWGEYVIVLREHPLAQQPLGNLIFINDFPLSYKIQLVSFPFVPNCWNDANNCSSPNNDRFLTMPDEPYESTMNGWGVGTNPSAFLYNIRENGSFFNPGNPAGTHLSGADGHPEAFGFIKF